MDRVEGIRFGNTLLQGRVIEHCLQEHHFHDLPYFYHFVKEHLVINHETDGIILD